ncbi:MAG TPA: helix-turn-helix transcriptional regulator [Clostridium sp.]
MKITGAILKKLRIKRKITLEELSKDVNEGFNMDIDANTITKWELGESEPIYNQLKCLASYYNVTTDFLLGFDLDNFVDIIDLRDDLEINKMVDEMKSKLSIQMNNSK